MPICASSLPGKAGDIAVMEDRQYLFDIYKAALAAVDPCAAVLKAVSVADGQLRAGGACYRLGDFERIVVVGAGKATARMALAIESLLGNKISAGLIVVKEGHKEALNFIEQVESAHPVPAAAGVAATLRILELARAANDKTLLFCLLSGGASALLVAPAGGLTLRDKQETTRLLLNAGASISELNSVRKHLSAVKGGRLAQAAYPAQILALVLSDVIGDPLEVIASGPVAPDPTTFAAAMAVIKKVGLPEKIPPRVLDYLQRGINGKKEETVKDNAPCFARTRHVIVGSLQQAIYAAQEKITRAGFAARVVSAALQGEARNAAQLLAREVREELARMNSNETRFLLCGGETTVTVRGTGSGGRNQELALAFALEVAGMEGVMLLSAATDGTDGPTDAAGASVDGDTLDLARSRGIDPLSYLDNNDSYTFFQRLDALAGTHSHFKSGPTGTNVMDMQIVRVKISG